MEHFEPSYYSLDAMIQDHFEAIATEVYSYEKFKTDTLSNLQHKISVLVENSSKPLIDN